MQMLCISISFIHKHDVMLHVILQLQAYCLVECNLNTPTNKYQKYRKYYDIFNIFENIAIFSNPAKNACDARMSQHYQCNKVTSIK